MNNLVDTPLAAVAISTGSTTLLINIVILVAVLVVAFWIVGKMAPPNPLGTLLRLIVGVLGLLWLLNLLGAIGGHTFAIYTG